jgi:hypothetical protein
VLRGANLAVRFALELCALAIAAYWGWETATGALRVVLALAAPVAVIVVWGLFVAPKRKIDLPHPEHGELDRQPHAVAVVSGILNYAWSD